jgi:predicted 2-oxoglutarate/Fe(II)-dependent dioxygenase YbiX
VGLLNDDFTGGEFVIGEKKINLTGGDIVMFPSNFMFPHKVNTINNGERYSFVSWVW